MNVYFRTRCGLNAAAAPCGLNIFGCLYFRVKKSYTNQYILFEGLNGEETEL